MENMTPRFSYRPPPEERTFIGRYRIVRQLGRGGMGEVLQATDPDTGKDVAIKILDAEGYADEDLLRRFEREAQSAMTLDHPNVAKFYGVELDEHGKPIIVMEYIAGTPMDRYLRNATDIPFSRLVDFVIQAARGLENAFRRSIIHRDIKPSNLIVTPEKVVKIIDFGLAKSLWDPTALTGSGIVVGTPRYISPEQGLGRSVDHRSDIYSLGATMYELLTRQSPFDGDTPMAIMMKHINTPLVPPYMINPRIPADLSEIVMRMMAKDPKDRYQDYEPLIRDLESAKIHRLAKERLQVPGMENVAGSSPTVQVPQDGVPGGAYSGTGRARPASYLTEGLVNVDFSTPPEAPASKVRAVLLSIAGLVVIGIAAMAYMQPAPNEPQTRRKGTLGKRLAMVFRAPADDNSSTAAAERMVREDEERIDTTRSRMEATLNAIISQQTAGNSSPASIRRLRQAGVLNTSESVDAWGNDFYVSNSGTGGGTLIAAGRDGQENTDDDFRFSLDGTERQIPDPLTIEDYLQEQWEESDPQEAEAEEGTTE